MTWSDGLMRVNAHRRGVCNAKPMTRSIDTSVDQQAHAPPDQSEVVALLSAPSTYGADVEEVHRIETHGAIVFLAGSRAYKLKRAVQLPYMDFSTLEKRAAACRHELERNQPAAPDIYIEVLPVVRRATGDLALGGDGVPVDWVVVMNQFDQAELFDALARADKLPLSVMPALAGHIADYHAAARTFRAVDGSASLANVVSQVVTSLFEAGDSVGLDRAQLYARKVVTELNARSRLLRARSHDGFVRLCHGDLHLRNIVLQDGRPTLFDAIEFDDTIATIDLLYDLAFLLMDLWHRDLKNHANLCFGSYVSAAVATDDLDGLAALPLFLSVRAAVRAMVAIDKAAVTTGADRKAALDDIDAYVDLALELLQPQPPSLIAVGGLSGTGKTTVSAALAPTIGRTPGALHLRSDVERKRMAGVDPLVRLPPAAYSKATSDKVYKSLCDRAEQALKAGHSVVVDAVFDQAAHRRRIEQVAARARVPFLGVWLVAPEETLIERVSSRRNDASDADASVVQMQVLRKTTVTCWETVDSSGDRSDAKLRIESALRAHLSRS